MSKNGRPYMPNIEPIIAAGINPKTGLPFKMGGNTRASTLNSQYNQIVSRMDRDIALNRFTWYNLPKGLTADMIERILYYRGQGMFFYMEANEKFYFLPYTLSAPEGTSGLDVYGRYVGATPVPFAGGSTEDNKKLDPWIKGLNFECQYDIIMPDELEKIDRNKKCVLLHDYQNGIGQMVSPRATENRSLIDLQTEALQLMRTALINGSGARGLRVDGEDEKDEVFLANQALQDAALNGFSFVPIVAPLELQELTGTNIINVQDFLLAMQSIENIRLSSFGIENGGIFQKKAHELQSENDMIAQSSSLTLSGDLFERQKFCDIINSIWGLMIWVEPKMVSGETGLGIEEKEETEEKTTEEEVSTEGGMDNV